MRTDVVQVKVMTTGTVARFYLPVDLEEHM